MFPSSDPAAQFPATSQPQQDDDPNWDAPDYPGDQQNTPYQWIAGNGPGNSTSQEIDDLFEDDEEEPAPPRSDSQEPEDEFAPGGWSNNENALGPAGQEQDIHEQPPVLYTTQHADWSQPNAQSLFYFTGPQFNGNHSHMPPAHHYHDHHVDPNDTPSFNFTFQHEGHDPQPQSPSRQQSLRPNAPYSGYASTDSSGSSEYQGGSDIKKPRAASSSIDELFSDVEDHTEGGLDGDADSNTEREHEESVETQEVDEVGRTAVPVLDVTTTQGTTHLGTDGEDEGPFDIDELESIEPGQAYNTQYGPSPTESQLPEEGFEFHNELPEELQIAKFNDKAFRKALREVRPELPRKQQWYAWQKVAQILDEKDGDQTQQDNGYDPSQPQKDFPAEAWSSHHGCQCGGDPSQCTCAPGRCGCSGCPRNRLLADKSKDEHAQSQSQQEQELEEDEGHHDAPMDIGTTPITPRFPNVYDKHGIQRIPGLGQLPKESEDEDHSPAWSKGQNHHCQCGDNCQCPPGGCQCPKLDQPTQYHQDRVSDDTSGRPIENDAHAQQGEPAPTPPPQHSLPSTSNPPSSAPQRPYYTPQQGFSIVRDNPASEASTPLGTPPQITPISRPDTPRPQDSDVRQSVEPEMPLPNWHRDSTPAYTDRSPSPSPVSRRGDFDAPKELDRIDGIDDVAMRDITPTIPAAARAFHAQRARSREGSAIPMSPVQWNTSKIPVPRTSSPAIATSPARHLMPVPRSPRPESQPPSPRRWAEGENVLSPSPMPETLQPPIPAPPIPSSSSQIKPTKQRTKRKSTHGVQGSKIEKPKSRNVTAKQRKATEKIVKQEAKDAKEGKQGGKVAEAVAKIEGRLQADGTPPRRSARIRELRVASGSPVSYKE